MNFDSFPQPNMNNLNPNEKQGGIPPQFSDEQMNKADSILKGSTLSIEEPEKKAFESFNYEINPEKMVGIGRARSTGGVITKDPFDEAGRHVPGDAEAEKVAKIMKGTSADKWTLQ